LVTKEQAALNVREHLGKDTFLTKSNDIQIGSNNDFVIVKYEDNLGQAIFSRLRTYVGELTLHLDYGCRLPELIGTNADELTLSLAKQHVKEALLQEPRIKLISYIRPTFRDLNKQIIDIDISVQPIDSLVPLNLVYALFL
jgi:phage baseplate assembly protein W